MEWRIAVVFVLNHFCLSSFFKHIILCYGKKKKTMNLWTSGRRHGALIVPRLQIGTFCVAASIFLFAFRLSDYRHLSGFVSVAHFVPGLNIVIQIKHGCCFCCCCCLTSPLTRVGNKCHLHMILETSATSADSHVCSGLLFRVWKQPLVNKRKQSALHMRPASQQMTSNSSLYSLSLFSFPSLFVLQ